MSTPQTDPNKPLTDADIVKGGPADPNDPMNKPPGDDANPQATTSNQHPASQATAPAPAAAAPAAPIVVNGRQFRDAEELAHYTAAIEAKVLDPNAGKPQGPKIMMINGKPASQVMYEDPDLYNEWVLTQASEAAYSRMSKETQAKDNQTNFWNSFYTENPDLKDMDFVVQSKFRETYDSIGKLPVSQAKAELAKGARAELEKIRQKSGIKTTEMPSGGATTLGSSSGSAPRATTPAPSMTFIEQVKAARTKRA